MTNSKKRMLVQNNSGLGLVFLQIQEDMQGANTIQGIIQRIKLW